MSFRPLTFAGISLALAGTLVTSVLAQRRDAFVASRDHAAIQYTKGPVDNRISALNAALAAGSARLDFEPSAGYLRAVLRALDIPVESQSLVFSPGSLQADRINMHNPRALYFTDTVAVGWVRGGDMLEVAALDPRQGVIFYSLPQSRKTTPQFERSDQCLACHLSWDTLGVPGLMVGSMFPLPDDPNAYANGFNTVQGSPLEQRFGGWWVTGNTGGARHMGNVPVMPADAKRKIQSPTANLTSVKGLFDLTGYPTPFSDIVPQLVLAHQARMSNLIARVGWEARVAASAPSADATARVREAAVDLVDYMLFIDEAPLSPGVASGSGFTTVFAARGPKDSQGRSLRDFDLKQRLFRYPCSYMIYTDAFDAMPATAKDAVYARLITVLGGRATEPRYKTLTAADRRAVAQILHETKKGLPASFATLLK
jgi:hypothetical protein